MEGIGFEQVFISGGQSSSYKPVCKVELGPSPTHISKAISSCFESFLVSNNDDDVMLWLLRLWIRVFVKDYGSKESWWKLR